MLISSSFPSSSALDKNNFASSAAALAKINLVLILSTSAKALVKFSFLILNSPTMTSRFASALAAISLVSSKLVLA